MTLLLLTIAWLICGVIGGGICMGDFTYKYPKNEHDGYFVRGYMEKISISNTYRSNLSHLISGIVFGPIVLIVSLFLSERYKIVLTKRHLINNLKSKKYEGVPIVD